VPLLASNNVVLVLASGSALAGAATRALFVVDTAPLFALLGYLTRKAATVEQRRPIAATRGLVVLGMRSFTFNSGLELAGSPLAAAAPAVARATARGSRSATRRRRGSVRVLPGQRGAHERDPPLRSQRRHRRPGVRRRRTTLEVSDDGRGGARAGPGSGLQGLADRLAALGAELHVDSLPGGGTRVRAALPCG
jgi:hypothetical protein